MEAAIAPLADEPEPMVTSLSCGALDSRRPRRSTMFASFSPDMSRRSRSGSTSSVFWPNMTLAEMSTTSKDRTSVASLSNGSSCQRCPECYATLVLPLKRCPRCSSAGGAMNHSGHHSGQLVPGVGQFLGGGMVNAADRDKHGHAAASTRKLPKLDKIPKEAQKLLVCLKGTEVNLDDVEWHIKSCHQAVNVRDENFGWSPILFAAHMGDVQLIMLLVRYKAYLEATCAQGNSALHLAARGNQVEAMGFMLEKQANLEAQNVHGWSPLAWTAIAGCPEAATLLLTALAEVDSRDTGSRTPCMWAARHGHTGIVRMLLASSVDLLLQDKAGQTLEDHAVAYDMLRRSLPEASPPSSPKHAKHMEPLSVDGSVSPTPDLRRLSRIYGASTQPTASRIFSTPVMIKEEQQALSSATVPSEVIAGEHARALKLLTFAEEGNWETALALVKKGACLGTRGLQQRSPLMWAAIHKSPEAVLAMANSRANLGTRDAYGWTVLHHAVHSGSCQVVSMLYYLGADFAASTDAGDTVVHLAARADAGAMLQLIRPVTDLKALDGHGHTPLQISVLNGCTTALSTLLAQRADPMTKDARKRSAFLLCVTQGHQRAAQVLMEPLQPLAPPWHEDQVVSMLGNLSGYSKHARKMAHSSSSGSMPGDEHHAAGSPPCSRQSSLRRARKKDPTLKVTATRERESLQSIQEVMSLDEGDGSLEAPDAERSRPWTPNSQAEAMSPAVSPTATLKLPTAHGEESPRGSEEGSRPVTPAASLRSVCRTATLKLPTAHGEKSPRASEEGSRPVTPVVSLRSSGEIIRTASQRSLGHKSSSSTATPTAARSSTDGKGPRHKSGKRKVAVPHNPYGLMMAASKAQANFVGEAPLTRAAALSSKDEDGRGPLALAVQAQKLDMVNFLLKLRAEINSQDAVGNTPLMLAAIWGDRAMVGHLIEVRAQVDMLNNKGQRTAELGLTAEIRRTIQQEEDRHVVKRRMQRFASMPPAKSGSTPKPSKCRLRLEGLPVKHSPDVVEATVRNLLEEWAIKDTSHVEVAVDLFTCRPRGHCFIDFPDSARAAAASATIQDESNLWVEVV